MIYHSAFRWSANPTMIHLSVGPVNRSVYVSSVRIPRLRASSFGVWSLSSWRVTCLISMVTALAIGGTLSHGAITDTLKCCPNLPLFALRFDSFKKFCLLHLFHILTQTELSIQGELLCPFHDRLHAGKYLHRFKVYWISRLAINVLRFSEVCIHPKFDNRALFRYLGEDTRCYEESKAARSLVREKASSLAKTERFWNVLLVSKECVLPKISDCLHSF